MLSGFIANAQKGKQDIKLDLLDALALQTVEVSYEYYLSDKSSVGLSALFNLAKKEANFRYNENTMFTPYFRHAFAKSGNWDVFGEVFFGVNNAQKEITSKGSPTRVFEKYTDAALGVTVGLKYVSEGGFVIDAYGGGGRNLFSQKSVAFVPRLGISLGYRF